MAKKKKRTLKITELEESTVVEGDYDQVKKRIDAIPKEQRDRSPIAVRMSDIAPELGISKKDIETLIEEGELEEAPPEKFGKEKGEKYITNDSLSRLFNGKKPVSALADAIYGKDPEFKDRLNPDQIEKEIGRFNPKYRDGLNLVVIKIKEPRVLKRKVKEKYSGEQLEKRLSEIGEETITNVRWGTEILTEALKTADSIFEDGIRTDRYSVKTRYDENSYSLRRVLDYFNLTYNKKNLNRIIRYNENGHFHFEDLGLIPKILRRHTFGSEDEKNEMGRYLRLLYRKFYSTNELENEDISKVAGRTDITLFSGVIDLRTTLADIEEFKKETINPLQLSMLTFDLDLNDYFLKKGDDFDIVQLIKEEAALYGDFRIDLPEPMMMDGQRRYHSSDSDDFKAALKENDFLSNIQLGIRMKLELESYKLDSGNDKGLTAAQVAGELGTTEEKAGELVTFVDVGLIHELGRKTKRGYDAIEKFYLQYFKDKVDGFNDEEVRDFRIDKASLEQFIAQNLQEAPFDLKEADEELNRQHDIDGNKGILFSNVIQPLIVHGKSLYTKEQIAKIEELMGNDELRKRVEWGKKLKKAYSKPDFSDYIKVDALKAMLGLNDEDWERLKPRITIEHPAIKKIEYEEAQKKAKDKSAKARSKKCFDNPAEFDERYFKDEFKEYIAKKYADNFKNKFYQPKTVAHAMIGIEASIHSLLEESNKLSISLEELKPYNLDSEGKKGEFYLNSDIAELKTKLSKESLNNLTLALAISAKIDEARDEGASDYETTQEAAQKLGVSTETLKEYIKKEHLKKGDIGIAAVLTKLINKSYSTFFNETDVVRFCKKDNRYSDVRETEGILNLNGFIANTLTLEEAQEQVSGDGWLATAVFEYCCNSIEPSYLKIGEEPKIHNSDVEKIETYQKEHLPLDIIRAEIARKLKVAKLRGRYKQLNNITRNTDKAQLGDITDRVDKFMVECYSRADILSKFGLRFSDDASVTRLMQQIDPRSIQFLEHNYHISDVNGLNEAIELAAKRIGVTKQRIIAFTEKGYIILHATGVSDAEIRRLRDNSYSQQDIAKISETLSENTTLRERFFSGRCPINEIQEYIRTVPVNDITREGMVMLINDETWRNYVARELNGYQHNHAARSQEISYNIVAYLINDINIQAVNGKYKGTDFTRLYTFAELLEDNAVHNILQFKVVSNRHGNTVDPEKSYYTKTEVLKMIKGVDHSELDRVCGQKGIEYLGKDLPQEGREYNDIGLFKVKDTAEILKAKGDPRLRHLQDPLEVVIMHKVLDACTLLNIEESSEALLRRVKPKNLMQMASTLKTDRETDYVRDSVCYQRMQSAFETIRNAA